MIFHILTANEYTSLIINCDIRCKKSWYISCINDIISLRVRNKIIQSLNVFDIHTITENAYENYNLKLLNYIWLLYSDFKLIYFKRINMFRKFKQHELFIEKDFLYENFPEETISSVIKHDNLKIFKTLYMFKKMRGYKHFEFDFYDIIFSYNAFKIAKFLIKNIKLRSFYIYGVSETSANSEFHNEMIKILFSYHDAYVIFQHLYIVKQILSQCKNNAVMKLFLRLCRNLKIDQGYLYYLIFK